MAEDQKGHELDVGSSARKGFAWTGIAQGIKSLLDFVVGIFIARILDPRDFGVVSSCMIFTSFVSIFNSFGFSTAIVQRKELDPQFVKTAQTLSVSMGGISTLTLFLCSGWIGVFYRNPEVAKVASVMSLIFIITSLNIVPNALLTRNLQFHKITLVSVLGSICYGAIAVPMALAGYGVWSIVVGPLISSLIGTIFYFIAASYFPTFGLNFRYARELLNFGKFVTVSSLLNHVARNADNLVIGRYLGADLLGLYARAYNLATIPKELLVSVFGSVLFPSFSRMQHDLSWVKRVFLKSINAITLFSLPVAALFVLTTPELVHTVYGAKWSGAILPLRLLGFAGFVYSLYVPCTSLLLGLGKVRLYSVLQLLYSSALVSSVLVAYRYGISYVAGSVFVVIVVVFAAYAYDVGRVIRVSWRDYYDSMKVSLHSSLIMMACLLMVKFTLPLLVHNFPENAFFLFEVIVAIIVYLGLILRTKDEIVTEFVFMIKKKICGKVVSKA
ncbi:MAG: lipopolysaccharide biosynthesis protein [Desulfobacteraceae bacterium]|nr:lipopolysaccharide biosynthesis protein [Desulfobacteraceae bacterium]